MPNKYCTASTAWYKPCLQASNVFYFYQAHLDICVKTVTIKTVQCNIANAGHVQCSAVFFLIFYFFWTDTEAAPPVLQTKKTLKVLTAIHVYFGPNPDQTNSTITNQDLKEERNRCYINGIVVFEMDQNTMLEYLSPQYTIITKKQNLGR